MAALLRSSLFVSPQPAGRRADPGLFGPGSATWVVCRERVGLAGAQATLLLQIAHPLIAAGVADHSTFREDSMRRLRGTLQATLTALFGDTEQAEGVARRVGVLHRGVSGTLSVPVAPYPAGAPYDALDPELGRWVHATLVAMLIHTREVLVGRLDPDAKARCYSELKALGTLFGVPVALQSPTLAEFEAYLDRMVARLTVSAEARDMAAVILDPPRPLLLAPAGSAARLLTAALLPEQLRRAYGLPDDALHRAARRMLVVAVRTAVRAVPGRLRFWPHYHTARARMAATGRSGARSAPPDVGRA
jgi:uncharacterized protein (DUF2236 family)